MNIVVVAITEHWLKPHEKIEISGFEMASSYVRKANMHGGSCLLIRSGLDYEELRSITEMSIELIIECSAIKLKKSNTIIINIYRPPLGNIDEFMLQLETILHEISSHLKHKIVISGDFNIDLSISDINTKLLLNMMEQFGLHPTISAPTRITARSRTTIDNIFTNIIEYDSKVIFSALSDHLAQSISFEIEDYEQKTAEYLDIKSFTPSKLKLINEELQNIDWSPVLCQNETDACYNTFIDILTETINNFIKKKTVQVRKGPGKQWLTEHIKFLSAIKRQLYEGMLNNRITSNDYKEFCVYLKKEIEKSKQQTYIGYIQNTTNKQKAVWNMVNEILGRKRRNTFSFDDFVGKYNDKEDVLEAMNNFLVEVGQSITSCNTDLPNCACLPETFSIFLTDPVEIMKVIGDLANSGASGEDEIPVSLLKHCSENLALPLAHIANVSFQTGIFPERLKYTIVKPLHKKGDRGEFNNYRPIALTSNISKIIEKLIYSRMLRFIDKNNILNKHQNGYIRGRSTMRASFQLLVDIMDGICGKNLTACAFIDLSKAFDLVHHRILLHKLENMGFRGVIQNWLESYLCGRKQCVVSNDVTGTQIRSSWKTTEYGIPQGSILGPFLFLLYVNDLPDAISDLMILFADDTSFVVKAETRDKLVEKLDNNLKCLSEWFQNHNLKINSKKTNIMCFNGDIETVKLEHYGEEITSVNASPFLGLKIDSRLSWKDHVDSVASVLSSYCFSLKIVSQNIGIESALSVYRACVESRIRYGIAFWGNSVDAHRIFVAQKACLRGIFRMGPRETCRRIFVDYKILTFPSLYILETAVFVKTYYHDFFQKYELQHKHLTRGKLHTHLCPPFAHLTKIQRQILNQSINIYNRLPEELKDVPLKTFKLNLKKYLLTHSFYSLDEFYQ